MDTALPRYPATIAGLLDHTVLDPQATRADILAACATAVSAGCASVCVRPEWVAIAARALTGSDVRVTTVVAFPTGQSTIRAKVLEARTAQAAGADEIDMVADLRMLAAGDTTTLAHEVSAVRAAVADAVLKVILETATLSDEQIVAAARVCAHMGADFVKTSTGYHSAGGASTHAVALLATAGIGVKASGGIRTRDDAQAMLEAGATRIGTSATEALVSGQDAPAPAPGY